MSIFSESKTLNSSILKSTPSHDRIKENQSRVRFKLNDTTAKIKDVFNESELNTKNYQNLIYKLAQIELKVSRKFHMPLLSVTNQFNGYF